MGLYRGPTGSPVVANSDVLASTLMERLQVNEADDETFSDDEPFN